MWWLIGFSEIRTTTNAFVVMTRSTTTRSQFQRQEQPPLFLQQQQQLGDCRSGFGTTRDISITKTTRKTTTRQWAVRTSTTTEEEEEEDATTTTTTTRMPTTLDIVLFGVGDLRVDDHVGLYRALTRRNNNNYKEEEDATDEDGGSSQGLVVPLCILDNTSLQNIPGVVAHTTDTAHCLHHALTNLQDAITTLSTLYNNNNSSTKLWSTLQLQFSNDDHNNKNDNEDDNDDCPTLMDCLQQTCHNLILSLSSSMSSSSIIIHPIRIHVCDLGPVDNQMAYGPYGQLQLDLPNNNNNKEEEQEQLKLQLEGMSDVLIEIVPWKCSLRKQPWEEVSDLPTCYPDYVSKYTSTTKCQTPVNIPMMENVVVPTTTTVGKSVAAVAAPQQEMTTTTTTTTGNNNHGKDGDAEEESTRTTTRTEIPTIETFTKHLIRIVKETSCIPSYNTRRVAQEHATGLYLTHWGGLSCTTIGCISALEIVQAYCALYSSSTLSTTTTATTKGREQQQEQQQIVNKNVDMAWTRHVLYPGRSVQRNRCSLEHAAMIWQLQGKGQEPTGTIQNWMDGEIMIRFLTAPLLFGTLSSRRIWWESQRKKKKNNKYFGGGCDLFLSSLLQPPLEQMMESREWHMLLAAHRMITDPKSFSTYGPISSPAAATAAETKKSIMSRTTTTTYRYWRYQGFLCRYAVTPLRTTTTTMSKEEEEEQQQATTTTTHDSREGGGVATPQKEGLLLIHGFGASGGQWNKAMTALQARQQEQQQQASDASSSSTLLNAVLLEEGLAPDLLGFGESEKPALSYTGYFMGFTSFGFCQGTSHATNKKKNKC